MGNLSDFIKAEGSRKEIQNELTPIMDRLHRINDEITKINDNLTIEEKKIIEDAIWENIPEQLQQKILDVRRRREEMFNGSFAYAATDELFDPYTDSWYIVTYEVVDEGHVKFQVSCRRREGTISGLYTFLDTYWTVPIEKNKIFN